MAGNYLEDTDPMPFGKYKGKALANVPDEYLRWLWESWRHNGIIEPPKSIDNRAMYEYLKFNADVLKLKP